MRDFHRHQYALAASIQRLSDQRFALHGAHSSSIVATLKGSSVGGSVSGTEKAEAKPKCSAENHNRILRDQRAIDRGTPNHQTTISRGFQRRTRRSFLHGSAAGCPSPSVKRI